jgi:hypothetical protein
MSSDDNNYDEVWDEDSREDWREDSGKDWGKEFFPRPTSVPDPEAPVVPDPTPDSLQVSPDGPRPPPVKKGFGREAKGQSPTPWDDYDYEHRSHAWVRLKTLGKEGISMENVLKLVAAIDQMCLTQGLRPQSRPRMASRRKAVAFHFLDERWRDIRTGIFDRAVGEVLRESSGVQKRGPKGKQ